MNNQIFEQVDVYIKNLLAPEDKALTETVQSIKDEGLPQISVSANQGKLLQIFATICHARKILELGTLAGYSTIWLARSLPKGGKVVTIESDPHHAEVAKKNINRSGLSEMVDIRIGKAMEIIQKMIDQNESAFDLIFIDADKPPYAEYFQKALELSHSGTIIICDNVIREGQVLNPEKGDERVKGVHRLNEMLSKNQQVIATILQTVGAKEHDGMAIAVVK